MELNSGRKGLMWFLAIIAITVLATCGYFAYKKIEKETTIPEDTTKIEDERDKIEQEKEEQAEKYNKVLIDNLAKTLFERTLEKESTKYYYLYQTDKKNVLSNTNISNSNKLIIAYKLASKEKIINLEYINNKRKYTEVCFSEDSENKTECYLEKIPKNSFEQAYYNLFGDTNIKYESFILDEVYTCNLNGNFIICNNYDNNEEQDKINNLYQKIRYKESEMINEDIYIYTEIVSTEDYEEYISGEDLFTKHPDNIEKYKVTFKQNKDKSYYWFATEIIKDPREDQINPNKDTDD